MSKASEDSAPRQLRGLIQKKFLDEVIGVTSMFIMLFNLKYL